MSDSSDGTWVRIAGTGELEPGEMKGVEVSGSPVLLANVDGTLYALADECSHEDYPLSDGGLEGTAVECAYHGARFDVCTGRAMTLPAVRPVRSYDVEEREEGVFVRLEG